MDQRVFFKFLVRFCLILFSIKILFAMLLPITQDEAYYFMWSKFLDFGYFDHPPAVAWLGWIGSFGLGIENSVLFNRLGAMLFSTFAMFMLGKLYFEEGIRQKKVWILSMLFANFNLAGLLFGFLSTPDAVLGSAWIIALREAILATKEKSLRWRWLLAGVATGIGLLGKFTMLLIGPIFLWGLITNDRKALKTAWPYLGALVAILIYLPNLIWNHQHNWVTWQFQLRHGFSMERNHLVESRLPGPLPYLEFSPEAELAKPFIDPNKKPEKPERDKTQLERSMQSFGDFIGAQLIFLGFFLFLITYILFKNKFILKQKISIPQNINPIFWAGCLFPLGLFSLISLKGKVEGNWGAMYVFSIAPILAILFKQHFKALMIAAFLNVALLTAITAHGKWQFLPTKAKSDRVLLETAGYKNLAQSLANLQLPIFADSYQIVSMVRFYQPQIQIMQWPGITRPSEYLRRTEIYRNFQLGESFWLVTTDFTPPRLPGYTANSLTQIYDCKNLPYLITQTAKDISFENDVCEQIIHQWRLVGYKKLH